MNYKHQPVDVVGENKWFRKQCCLFRHQEGIKRSKSIAPLILNPGAGLLCELTLRRLMSYIYMEHPFLMFLDHTRRRSTVGRTPLDE